MILSIDRKIHVVNAAAEFLLSEEQIQAFPFSLEEQLAKRDILIKTSDQAEQFAMKTGDVLAGLPEAAIYRIPFRDGFRLVLFCSAYMDPPERGRFSFAHELGHLILQHEFSVFGEIGSMDPAAEAEADLFAANILAPAPIVRQLKHPQRQRSLFGLSPAAWKVRLQTLDADQALLDPQLADALMRKFEPFMHKKRCRLCHTVFILPQRQCPHCLSEKTVWIGRETGTEAGTPFPG